MSSYSMEHECDGAKPSWAVDHGLATVELCGQFADDYEAVLTCHRIETVTSYGVRRSRQTASSNTSHHSLRITRKTLRSKILRAKMTRYKKNKFASVKIGQYNTIIV